MSAVTLHIKNKKTDETLGILTSVNLDARLEGLRTRIDSELSIFTEYDFVVFGTVLKTKQERKYLVSNCIVKSTSQDYICYLQTNLPSSTNTKLSEAYFEIHEEQDEVPVVMENPSKRVVSKLIELYSEQEIKEASGLLSKEKITFFNRKATEIASDSFFDNWGVHEIQGVIDVHWTLNKTGPLKSCVEELMSNSCDESGRSLQSVLKNLEGLNKAQVMTDKHYRKFCQELSQYGEGKREELENKFDEIFSGLKVAQSDLVKSFEQYHIKSATVTTQHMDTPDHSAEHDYTDGSSECPFLVDEEMDILVDSIMDNYEQED